MAASLVEIEIIGGISQLRCPVTGIHVLTPDDGFDPDSTQSPHLRFFVDVIGNIWVAAPDDLPPEQAKYQKEIIAIFERQSEFKNQNSLIAQTLDALPKSAFVLEILDPPQGSFDGLICYACFDLGGAANKARIKLEEVS